MTIRQLLLTHLHRLSGGRRIKGSGHFIARGESSCCKHIGGVSQADVAAACVVYLDAQTSSDASAVFPIALIREVKCHTL